MNEETKVSEESVPEQSIREVQQLSNNQYISGFIFDAKVLTFDKFVTPWKPFLSEVYPNRL